MAMAEALTTTSTPAPEALLDIKPLHVFSKQEAFNCAYRLHATGCWNSNPVDSTACYTLLWPQIVAMGEEILAPSDLTLACSFPYRTFYVKIPCRQEWLSGLVERRLEEQVTCYTDGSLMEGRAGTGVYCCEMGLVQSHSLGRYCTVFQAEI